jgi:uncharacterized protein
VKDKSTAFVAVIVLLGAAGNPGWAGPDPGVQYQVSVREVWIPMKDGVRLSATLYMPAAGARGEKFPAVLEYLPYRKDELSSPVRVHEYFARHGYVSARVDIRGTGRSEGHTPDREYSRVEQEDAERVIAWLAHQDWSNGGVGMFGISWGGFNSVQMAMRSPPGLKAIIAICATEDLFREDVHFIDGMMHDDEYELNVDLQSSMTRSPDFPTDESSLAQRFDNPPWFVMYKQHPRAGAFWDAPVRPLASIRIPVFLIGGMLDGYRDSIPRMLQQIKAPTKALLGPWNHNEPDEAVPGPAIEWRDQAVEWWDHWLKPHAAPTQLAGPRLAVYMNHWYPPDVRIRAIPGEWRAESGWPPLGAHAQRLYLSGDYSLSASATPPARHELAYRPASTLEGGGPDFWWGDVNTDQRSVDAYSLVYSSSALPRPLSILGRPRACLQASASAPSAEWFVRISDVAPDGLTTLVSGGGLSGALRESARDPKPLTPGQEYALCFDLHLTSWVFPPNHRIRVAVSNAMWPMIWPTPYPMTTALRLGGPDGSWIELPAVPERSPLPVPTFGAPQADQARSTETTQSSSELNVSSSVSALSWSVARDPVHQQASVEWRGGDSADYPWGREVTREVMSYRADDQHPERSSVHGEADITVTLRDRTLIWRGILDTHSDRDFFYVQYQRELSENGKIKRSKTWQATVPRDGQ